MNIFSSVKNILGGGGGLGGKIVDTIKDYFPPNLSPAEKAALEISIKESAHRIELEVEELAIKADQEFNTRIKEMEGTAGDLQHFGFLGTLIVFLRGALRPIWGYLVIYMDIMVFSKAWHIEDDSMMEMAFLVINILVLGFLFGERAVKNVMPIITTYQESKRAK
jgi:hypothetical protein